MTTFAIIKLKKPAKISQIPAFSFPMALAIFVFRQRCYHIFRIFPDILHFIEK